MLWDDAHCNKEEDAVRGDGEDKGLVTPEGVAREQKEKLITSPAIPHRVRDQSGASSEGAGVKGGCAPWLVNGRKQA